MRIDDLARRFPEQIRRRGVSCHRAQVVTIKHHSAAVIRGIAIGNEDYEVRLEVEGRTLVLSCSCPYFESDGPCKHLWAMALAADERRLLAGMPSWTKVKLEMDDGAIDDDVYVDDEDDDPPDDDLGIEDHGETIVANGGGRASLTSVARRDLSHKPSTSATLLRLPYLARSPSDIPAPPPPAPDWKAVFLGETNRSPRPGVARAPDAPANLLYVIEVDKTRSGGELVVALRTRAPRRAVGSPRTRRRRSFCELLIRYRTSAIGGRCRSIRRQRQWGEPLVPGTPATYSASGAFPLRHGCHWRLPASSCRFCPRPGGCSCAPIRAEISCPRASMAIPPGTSLSCCGDGRTDRGARSRALSGGAPKASSCRRRSCSRHRAGSCFRNRSGVCDTTARSASSARCAAGPPSPSPLPKRKRSYKPCSSCRLCRGSTFRTILACARWSALRSRF